jgi:hypothetical protein
VTANDLPSIEEFVQMIEEGARLQIVPPGDWRYEDASVVLDVHPSNLPAPYWRAALRDDRGTASKGDAIRFVAARLRDVAVGGFPPRDFTEHRDGWYRISMTADGRVGDYLPDEWE